MTFYNFQKKFKWSYNINVIIEVKTNLKLRLFYNFKVL